MKIEASSENNVLLQQMVSKKNNLSGLKLSRENNLGGEIPLENTNANVDTVELSQVAREMKIYALDDSSCPTLSDGGISAYDSDGNRYALMHYQKKDGVILDKDFFTVLQQKANGQEDAHYQDYVNNFIVDVYQHFADLSGGRPLEEDANLLRQQCEKLVSEIAENKKVGKANPLEDLQTRLTVGGVDFTYSDLQASMNAMQYATSALPNHRVTLEYNDFASLGLTIGYINAFASEKLNEEQKNLLVDRITQRVNQVIDNRFTSGELKNNSGSNSHLMGGTHVPSNEATELHKKFFDNTGFVGVANMDYAKSILNLFSSVKSKNQLDQALNQYRVMIRPIYIGAGLRGESINTVTNTDISGLSSLFSGAYKPHSNTLENVKQRIQEVQNYLGIRQ